MRVAAIAVTMALVAASSAAALAVSGTQRADLIVGSAGRDTIDARGGDDRTIVWGDGRRDTVRCGTGLDLANAERNDVVSSDCETVVRQISRDRSSGDGAQIGTQAEPDSFSWATQS